MFCQNCGKPVETEGQILCEECSKKQQEVSSDVKPVEKPKCLGKGVWSLILGFIAFYGELTAYLTNDFIAQLIASIMLLIFAIISISLAVKVFKINKKAKKDGQKQSIAALVLSIIGLVLDAVFVGYVLFFIISFIMDL